MLIMVGMRKLVGHLVDVGQVKVLHLDEKCRKERDMSSLTVARRSQKEHGGKITAIYDDEVTTREMVSKTIADEWLPHVLGWVRSHNPTVTTVQEVYAAILAAPCYAKYAGEPLTMRAQNRIGRIMKKLGWGKSRIKREYVYTQPRASATLSPDVETLIETYDGPTEDKWAPLINAYAESHTGDITTAGILAFIGLEPYEWDKHSVIRVAKIMMTLGYDRNSLGNGLYTYTKRVSCIAE